MEFSFTTTTENGNEVEGSDNSANVSETDLTEELPIDMRFNNGHLLAIVVYSGLMLFSAVGNISVLGTILRIRRRQESLSAINQLILHLAIADLWVTFLMMPLEIAWNATVSWNGDDLSCRFLSFIRIFGLFLSSFIIICISVDRYYAVVHPLSFSKSGRRCRLLLSAAWSSSFLCSLPQGFIFHVETHPKFVWYTQCVTFNAFPSPHYEMAYNFFGFTFLYGIPLLSILGCYTCIIRKIWGASQTPGDDADLRRSSAGVYGRAKQRTLKMTLMIVLNFVCCWTPYNIMCLWYWLDKQSAEQVDYRVQKVLFLFACTNSCMNPLIYGLFHFRRRRSPQLGERTRGGTESVSLTVGRTSRS